MLTEKIHPGKAPKLRFPTDISKIQKGQVWYVNLNFVDNNSKTNNHNGWEKCPVIVRARFGSRVECFKCTSQANTTKEMKSEDEYYILQGSETVYGLSKVTYVWLNEVYTVPNSYFAGIDNTQIASGTLSKEVFDKLNAMYDKLDKEGRIDRYIQESLQESEETNLTLYTIQDLSVLEKLKNNETYVADYNNIFEPGYEDQYRKLVELHNLKNCPIFLASKESFHIIDSSYIKEDNDNVLLTFSIPKNMVHQHNYYDWTDYLYYTTQEKDEEYTQKLEEFIKDEDIIDKEDVEYVVDELKPEWLIDSSKEISEELKQSVELNESMSLDEATRSQLISKGQKGQNYKNQSKGKNRWARRTKSRISNTVRQYNDIDFDAFFKKDILNVGISVHGETDEYTVKLKFGGVLNEIARNIRNNNGVLEFKLIVSALMRVFNIGDVYVHCSCPDAKYRMNFWQTKNGYSSLPIETRPSNITNPNDLLGSACKHTLLVLSNLSWTMKVSSTINNYIKYCQKHMGRNYADYIFPKLYGMKYPEAVQTSMFEDGLLPTDQETIKKANEYGRKSTQFKPGNKEGIRFAKKETEEEPKQMTMDLGDNESEEDEIPDDLDKI